MKASLAILLLSAIGDYASAARSDHDGSLAPAVDHFQRATSLDDFNTKAQPESMFGLIKRQSTDGVAALLPLLTAMVQVLVNNRNGVASNAANITELRTQIAAISPGSGTGNGTGTGTDDDDDDGTVDTALAAQVTANVAAITANEAAITANEEAITANGAAITALDTRVVALEEAGAGTVDTPDVPATGTRKCNGQNGYLYDGATLATCQVNGLQFPAFTRQVAGFLTDPAAPFALFSRDGQIPLGFSVSIEGIAGPKAKFTISRDVGGPSQLSGLKLAKVSARVFCEDDPGMAGVLPADSGCDTPFADSESTEVSPCLDATSYIAEVDLPLCLAASNYIFVVETELARTTPEGAIGYGVCVSPYTCTA